MQRFIEKVAIDLVEKVAIDLVEKVAIDWKRCIIVLNSFIHSLLSWPDISSLKAPHDLAIVFCHTFKNLTQNIWSDHAPIWDKDPIPHWVYSEDS